MRKFKHVTLTILEDMNSPEFRYELNSYPIIVAIVAVGNNWVVVLEA
jgi:hypothetical protein